MSHDKISEIARAFGVRPLSLPSHLSPARDGEVDPRVIHAIWILSQGDRQVANRIREQPTDDEMLEIVTYLVDAYDLDPDGDWSAVQWPVAAWAEYTAIPE